MSESGSEESQATPSDLGPAPKPAVSGTKPEQREAGTPITGELVPKSQFSEVAACVSQEASGLVAADPATLGSLGAIRLLTSYSIEQAINAAALRKDLSDAQERERNTAADTANLRARLAVSTHVNDTEKRLRTPRTVFSLLGVTVAGFGVDQLGNGESLLGIALVAIGVVIVVATRFIAPADGQQS